jgi:hypothetical protein
MRFILSVLKKLKDTYDWAEFAQAAQTALQTKFGLSVIAGLGAMVTGAILQVTWYEMVLMGVGVAVVVQTFSILRILRRKKSPLELVWQTRVRERLHGATEWYSIGVKNTGETTLNDVTVRAAHSWFTRVIMAEAERADLHHGQALPLLAIASLHPETSESREIFGLEYGQQAFHPDYIVNTVQRFVIEAAARDVPVARKTFEYDPNARPMIRPVSE